MPHYRREGKLLNPMTDQQFKQGLEEGYFVQQKHRGLGVLLWLTGLRISEALSLKKEQFRAIDQILFVDTGIRKKKRLTTKNGKPRKLKVPDPLPIPLSAPCMDEILYAIAQTEEEQRVWPYSVRTGYNIIRRAWKYPHYFRLSRITNFLKEGYTIPDIKSWTTLTATAIDSYIGLGELRKMGESLGKRRTTEP